MTAAAVDKWPFAGWRIVQLMAAPGPAVGVDADVIPRLRAQRVAGLVAAHARGESVFGGWIRRPEIRTRRYAVLLGSSGVFPHIEESSVHEEDCILVNHPPGSRGVDVGAVAAQSVLSCFRAWTRCGGLADPSILDVPESGAEPPTDVFDEIVSHAVQVPFVWLVVATPADRGRTSSALEAARRLHFEGLGMAERSVGHRLAAERAEARYRELDQASYLGAWDVHVLIGAVDETSLAEVVPVLVSAASSGRLAYRLIPSGWAGSFEQMWGAGLVQHQGGVQPGFVNSAYEGRGEAATPFLTSTDVLDSLSRPPIRELPGFRIILPQPFDVTIEGDDEARLVPSRSGYRNDQVELGRVLDGAEQPAGGFSLTEAMLVRHTFVCGATGGGKSQTIRTILDGVTEIDKPWLVIEPAKAEYARMAGRLAARGCSQPVYVIRLGDPAVPPAMLNPLEPEPGFPLQTHVDLVQALFIAAFDAVDPFPQVLAESMRQAYEVRGWSLASGQYKRALLGPTPRERFPSYPTLHDLEAAAGDVVATIGYQGDVLSNVKGFMQVRLRSLRLGSSGRFFDGGFPIDIGEMLRRNVVLEIENVGGDQEKAFVIGAVLTRIAEHLAVREKGDDPARGHLRHITVVEEAHRLLRSGRESQRVSQAVEAFAGMLAEVRAYGEGLIIAEQIPTKVIPDVIKNTATRIVHRLPAGDDRHLLGMSMNVSEVQSQVLVSLPPGLAAAFTEGMDRPALVRIEYREEAVSDAAAISQDLPFLTSALQGPGTGHDCGASSCTVTLLDDARRFVEDETSVELWAEVVAMCWLFGIPAWEPTWIKELPSAIDRRGANPGCVAAFVAQRVVDRRWALLADYVAPTTMLGALRSLVEGFATGNLQMADAFLAPIGAFANEDPGPSSSARERRFALLTGVVPGRVGDRPRCVELIAPRAQEDHWWEDMVRGLARVCDNFPPEVLAALARDDSMEGREKAGQARKKYLQEVHRAY